MIARVKSIADPGSMSGRTGRLTDVPIDIAAFALVMLGFAALAFASLVAISGFVPPMRLLLKFFDVASEANLWTWANVAVLLSAAHVHLLAAYARWWRHAPGVAGWALTALLMAGLSLDDLAGLHERLEPLGEALGGGSGLTHFAWLVPGSAIALATLALFAVLVRNVEGRARLYLLAGILVFFAGAVGMEAVGGYALSQLGSGVNVTYVLLFHVEEMLEATGAALLLSAGLADLPEPFRRLSALLDRPPSAGADPSASSGPRP